MPFMIFKFVKIIETPLYTLSTGSYYTVKTSWNNGFRNRKEHYALNGGPLGIIKEEKDLGVIVYKNLKVGKKVFQSRIEGLPGNGEYQENVYKPIKRNNNTFVQVIGVASSILLCPGLEAASHKGPTGSRKSSTTSY